MNEHRDGESGPRTVVLGMGNVLTGDDALGPYVVRRLQARYVFPEEVSVEDVGTPGLDLHPYLKGRDAVVIVDTVRADGNPGDLRLYRRQEILRHPAGARVSPHDPGLKETLLSLEFAGGGPREVLLVGVIPQRVEAGVGLSPPVRAAMPAAEAAVLRELVRLGRAPVPLDPPREPDIWWEWDPGERERT